MAEKKAEIAIIGGTGLTTMDGLVVIRREMVKTPFGTPSGPLIIGELHGNPLVFLARHGHLHTIPPHRVNYCANIWALQSVGIKQIIAVAAVGGITKDCVTEALVIPDQVIDYTSGRRNTFFDGSPERVTHIDFTYPYTETLRQRLIKGARAAKVEFVDHGTYGATQGPRLESAAEIKRMAQDGCNVVGMTGMPEASLARELEMDYACYAVVVNKAAGINKDPIDVDKLSAIVDKGMSFARSAIDEAIALS